jgi:hypothetical protein
MILNPLLFERLISVTSLPGKSSGLNSISVTEFPSLI